MKKIVWMLIGIFILLNCSYAKTFTDVSSNHWARSIINEWTNNGIISGYTDGTFRPSGEVTKAELVTILNKINNDEEKITKRPSKDINLSDWYCVDMGVALKNGLVELDGNGNLNPKSLMTREDAITMIAKLFNLKYSGNSMTVLSKFSDVNKIEDKNLPYVAAMVKEGYVGGNNGKINPDKNITRAELVSLLDSTIEVIHTSGKISGKEINGNLVINGEKVTLSSVEVHGYIFVLKGAKNGQLEFNNVYASKGINSDYNNVISYNDGTKPHDNLSNKEEEKHADEVQFVKIVYSETGWTNENVTATLKFDGDTMEIINNNGKNKYKFRENGEFTFVCVDANGFEHRYTAKVDNIAKKDLEIALDVKDNINNAVVTVSILANEAPIKDMYYVRGSKTAEETIASGEEIINNEFKITETDTYTVAVADEAGNNVKQEFSWENTSKYLIDVIQNVGGKITPEEAKDIPYRGSQTFTITSDYDNGYDLIGVKVDGGLVESIEIVDERQATYTFTDITEPHTIEAIYKLRSYNIKVDQPIQNMNGEIPGKITPGNTYVEFGASQNFEFIPREGYRLAKVFVDGEEVRFTRVGEDGATYELTNVNGEHTISAEFEKKKYRITVASNSDNGTIEARTAEEQIENNQVFYVVEYGDEITFFITPDFGYEIKEVKVDNVSMGAVASYTFKNIDEDYTIVAIFEEIPTQGVLEGNIQLGENVYATIYEDNSCIIYGIGAMYNEGEEGFKEGQFGEYTTQINKVTIKTGVKNIGDSLFKGCTNLESIELSNTVESFGTNAFADCSKLANIEIPETMEEIKDGTFYNCSSLERIVIPDSIIRIGNDAFNGCYAMETKTLSKNLQEIGDRAFKDCRGLIDSLTIPEGTVSIGEEAFLGCDLLASIIVPKTVEEIGARAFNDCGNLKNITFKNRRKIDSLGRAWFPNGGDYKETTVGNNYVITRTSFEIIVESTTNGTIDPSGTVKVKKSSNKTFTIIPDEGYEVESIIIDGVAIDGTDRYTFVSVNRTHTIGATFRYKTYTIDYILNGGAFNNVEPPRTYNVESEVIFTEVPLREGYEFTGWIETVEGEEQAGTQMSINISTGNIGNRTYKATWNPLTYTIAYEGLRRDENDQYPVQTNPNPTQYKTGDEDIVLQDVEKLGYIFTGWTGNGTDTPTKGLILPKGSIGSKVYTANWEAIVYNVAYNLNNGEYAGTLKTTYTIEDTFTVSEVTRPGYNFQGWSGTDLIVNGDVYNLSFIVQNKTGDREYTAHWQPKAYTITYDWGYNLNAGAGNIIETDSYTVLVATKTLATPTRSGYTFLGWVDLDNPNAVGYVTKVSGSEMKDRRFLADWQAIPYTITYNFDYDGKTENVTYTIEDGDITLPTPTRLNYTFLGWIDADRPTDGYVIEFSANELKNKTFKAEWQEVIPTP